MRLRLLGAGGREVARALRESNTGPEPAYAFIRSIEEMVSFLGTNWGVGEGKCCGRKTSFFSYETVAFGRSLVALLGAFSGADLGASLREQ